MYSDSLGCKECKGEKTATCNRCCGLHTGYALCALVKNNSFCDTTVGELRMDTKTRSYDYRVIGHAIYENASGASDLLTREDNISIPISDKLLKAFSSNASSLASDYCNSKKVSETDRKEILSTLHGINRYLKIPKIFIPGDTFYLIDENGKESSSECAVSKVSWKFNTKEKRMKQKITFVTRAFGMKYNELDATEFGTRFFFAEDKMITDKKTTNKEVLKISDIGFIKPLKFNDKKNNNSIIVDNCYIYFKDNNTDSTVIVACWGDKSQLIPIGKYSKSAADLKAIQDTKAFKEFHKSINYVFKHRSCILPYLTYECNEINI